MLQVASKGRVGGQWNKKRADGENEWDAYYQRKEGVQPSEAMTSLKFTCTTHTELFSPFLPIIFSSPKFSFTLVKNVLCSK